MGTKTRLNEIVFTLTVALTRYWVRARLGRACILNRHPCPYLEPVELDGRFKPNGYNVSVNLGSTAGQTVMLRYIHLIPRPVADNVNPRGGVRGVIAGKADYSGADKKPHSNPAFRNRCCESRIVDISNMY